MSYRANLLMDVVSYIDTLDSELFKEQNDIISDIPQLFLPFGALPAPIPCAAVIRIARYLCEFQWCHSTIKRTFHYPALVRI